MPWSAATVFRQTGIGLLAVAAAAVLLAGFLKPVGGRVAARGVVTIQYWEKWTGPEADAMRQVVDRFNATLGKQRDIFVQYTSMAQVDQKTLISTAAGVPPDLAGIWDVQLAQFAAMNAIEPLDDLAAANGLTRDRFKPVYWDACHYNGKLFAIVSTPGVAALHYSKARFEQAGITRPPASIDELDRDAKALTIYETVNGRPRITSAGYLPLVPGWYIAQTSRWFGGPLFDDKTGQLLIESKPVVAAYDWIANYSRTLGKDAVSDFRSGLGSYASAQGPFISGAVAMELQGPWNAIYIEQHAPQMNRVGVPNDQLAREAAYRDLCIGANVADVTRTLGEPRSRGAGGDAMTWDAGIFTLTATFADGTLVAKRLDPLPALERRRFTSWAVAPFPSAVPGETNVAYCPFDALVIPRGSKHKAEAFAFLAFLCQQDVMESLCTAHCKNSPLRQVSADFITYHRNPYIGVFDELANSPNAFAVPSMPIWPQVLDEMSTAAERCYLLEQSPANAMHVSAERLAEKWREFKQVDVRRGALAAAGGAR